MTEIFRKHLTSDIKRIVVFCDHIKRIREVKKSMVQWLADAGVAVGKVYSVSSNNNRSEAQMTEFSQLENGKLNVMFAVNMLNEGVHVSNVNAVVMLRPTSSRIIHLQQMGRCMNASDKTQPIVFDLVDNIDKSDIYNLREEYKNKVIEYHHGRSKMETAWEIKSFIVEDNVKPVRDLIEKLNSENHLSIHYWTKEEVLSDAKNYNTKIEWKTASPQAYAASLKFGWHKEAVAHMQELRHHWTVEEIEKEAKKYDTIQEWKKKNPKLYKIAQMYCCVRRVTLHMSDANKVWTKDAVIASTKDYSDKRVWMRENPKAYNAALSHGWVDEITKHMTNKKHFWTFDEVQKDALNYDRLHDWRTQSRKAYTAAVEHKWVEEVTKHMRKGVESIWTDEKIISCIKQCISREEFKKKFPKAYGAARHRDYEKFMQYLKPLRNHWTKETVLQDALNYHTRSEWKIGNRTAYDKACRYGWLEEATVHMVSGRTNKQ